MKESSNWSNDSQSFSKLCILESQLETKDVQVATLKQENLVLKAEVERLQNLVNTLTTKDDINSNYEDPYSNTDIRTDILDRFK